MTDIEDLIRRIAANEAERVLHKHEQQMHSADRLPGGRLTDFPTPTELLPSLRCRTTARNGQQCVKERGHGQRHRYLPMKGGAPSTPRPTFTPTHQWEEVAAIQIPGPTGVRTYEVRVGSPVKVIGWGRTIDTETGEKAAQGGWFITKIQQRTDDYHNLANTNVELFKEGTHPRTVKADKLVYVKPTAKKMAARRPRKVSARRGKVSS